MSCPCSLLLREYWCKISVIATPTSNFRAIPQYTLKASLQENLAHHNTRLLEEEAQKHRILSPIDQPLQPFPTKANDHRLRHRLTFS